MKRGTPLILLASHAALIGFGWLIAKTPLRSALPETAMVGTGVAPSATPPPNPTSDPNPIFRANGADFRAAWDQMIRGERRGSGEPHWNSINFFIDWCAIDPEGAVLGLSELYSPGFGHNYLSNAVADHGARLAPALVKHWRNLRLQQEYKVEHVMGRALGQLAGEDPAGAVGLILELPPGKRAAIYDALFQGLETATMEELAERLPAAARLTDWERQRLWENFARELDRSDPDAGLWRWMGKTADPVALNSLADQGVTNSMRSNDWSKFLDTVARLDEARRPSVRDQVVAVLKTYGNAQQNMSRLADECVRRGLSDWAQAITGTASR